jgi:hypothetical protein
MIPGFPNLFTLMGPNSPIGNSSLVPIAEAQSRYALNWMERMRREGISEVEPTLEATEAFYEQVNKALGTTVWTSGCNSWYLNEDGRPILWPWPLDELTRRLTQIVESDFHLKRDDEMDAQLADGYRADSEEEFNSQLLKPDTLSPRPDLAAKKQATKAQPAKANEKDAKAMDAKSEKGADASQADQAKSKKADPAAMKTEKS